MLSSISCDIIYIYIVQYLFWLWYLITVYCTSYTNLGRFPKRWPTRCIPVLGFPVTERRTGKKSLPYKTPSFQLITSLCVPCILWNILLTFECFLVYSHMQDISDQYAFWQFFDSMFFLNNCCFFLNNSCMFYFLNNRCMLLYIFYS